MLFSGDLLWTLFLVLTNANAESDRLQAFLSVDRQVESFVLSKRESSGTQTSANSNSKKLGLVSAVSSLLEAAQQNNHNSTLLEIPSLTQLDESNSWMEWLKLPESLSPRYDHPSYIFSLNQLNDKFEVILGGLSMTKMIDVPVDVPALQQDVSNLVNLFGAGSPHYWAKEGWSLLPLVGCEGSVESQLPCYNQEYQPKPQYPTEHGVYKPTSVWEKSMYIRPLLEPLQDALQRVRISNLLPGKTVHWHRDREIPFRLDIPLKLRSFMQFDHGVCRVHLIVNNPPTAHLRLGPDTVHAKPGNIFCGDFTMPHTLWNSGHEMRTSILVDVLMDESVLRKSQLGNEILNAYNAMASERTKDGRTRTEEFQRMVDYMTENPPFGREAGRWPEGVSLFETLETNECCSCSSFPVDKFSTYTEMVRDALEKTVPDKWFLIQGSLIGSLRYGNIFKRLKSGKLSLVDDDIDAVVVNHPNERVDLVNSFMELLPGWSVTMREDGQTYIKTLEYVLPERCAKVSNPGKALKVDLHFIDEHDGGRLSVDQNTNSHVSGELRHWIDHHGSLPRDLFFPLRKVKFGEGVGYAPNRYIEILEHWNVGEYDLPLWKPSKKNEIQFPKDCGCELDHEDFDEIRTSIKALHDEGYASFQPPNGALLDTVPVVATPGWLMTELNGH